MPTNRERRHIKYRAKLLQKGSSFEVEVVILEQTHRNYEFTPRSDNFKHGEISIYSNWCPEHRPDSVCVFLCGSETSLDVTPLKFTVGRYQGFKQAVIAYNETYK